MARPAMVVACCSRCLIVSWRRAAKDAIGVELGDLFAVGMLFLSNDSDAATHAVKAVEHALSCGNWLLLDGVMYQLTQRIWVIARGNMPVFKQVFVEPRNKVRNNLTTNCSWLLD